MSTPDIPQFTREQERAATVEVADRLNERLRSGVSVLEEDSLRLIRSFPRPIVVDFNNVLVNNETPLVPNPEAKDFIDQLREIGTVIIATTATSWEMVKEYLERFGFWHEDMVLLTQPHYEFGYWRDLNRGWSEAVIRDYIRSRKMEDPRVSNPFTFNPKVKHLAPIFNKPFDVPIIDNERDYTAGNPGMLGIQVRAFSPEEPSLEEETKVNPSLMAAVEIVRKHYEALEQPENLQGSAIALTRYEAESLSGEEEFVLFNRLFGFNQENIERFYQKVALKYDPTNLSLHYGRLDQEAEIIRDLHAGWPVLIRSSFNGGKTSMSLALARHEFGINNTILEDLALWRNVSLDRFRRGFGLYHVARFIAEGELGDEYLQRGRDVTTRIEEEIRKSRKTPFEYLNEYLWDKTAFLIVDEAAGFAEYPSKLRYIASLKNLVNINLVVILSRVHKGEDLFSRVFSGDFKTHFLRPLTQDEVATMVRVPLLDTPIIFTDDSIEELFVQTGGKPWEVAIFCWTLLSPFFSSSSKQKLVYRAEDIKELVSHDLYTLVSTPLGSVIDEWAARYRTSLSDSEKVLLRQLCEAGRMSLEEVDDSLVQPLVDIAWVRKDEELGVYKINGEFLRWIISFISKEE